MANVLNQFGITQALADLLTTDTGVLYGNDKLIKQISADPVKYEKEKVDNVRNYRIYMWCADGEPIEERASNAYDDYRVDFKFAAKASKLIDAFNIFAQAWERVKYLVRQEMNTGQQLSQYYTDSTGQVYSLMPEVHSMPAPIPKDDGVLVSTLEGAILVQVNRWP